MVEPIEAGCASVADGLAYVDAPATTDTAETEASSRPLKALATFSIAACGGGSGGGAGGGLGAGIGGLPGASPGPGAGSDAGTLARWFGVPDDQLDGILPNLKNFGMTAPSGIAYPRNVGFMG